MAEAEGVEEGTERIALVIEYDGTDYSGFQVQANARTVQGELEEALRKLLRRQVRVKGASRTDSGVHAEGQVVAFDADAGYAGAVYRNALNYYLPEDIRVKAVYRVRPDFDPRRNATSRTYEYRILNTPAPSALRRCFVHWVSEPLDVERMGEAAMALVGTHDFAAFTVPCAATKGTIRHVYKYYVERRGELVVVVSEANAYLYQQIRRAAGVLLRIGKGEIGTEEIEELLLRKQCGSAGPLLPARGLHLVRVSYPDFPPVFGVDDDKKVQDISGKAV